MVDMESKAFRQTKKVSGGGGMFGATQIFI